MNSDDLQPKVKDECSKKTRGRCAMHRCVAQLGAIVRPPVCTFNRRNHITLLRAHEHPSDPVEWLFVQRTNNDPLFNENSVRARRRGVLAVPSSHEHGDRLYHGSWHRDGDRTPASRVRKFFVGLRIDLQLWYQCASAPLATLATPDNTVESWHSFVAGFQAYDRIGNRVKPHSLPIRLLIALPSPPREAEADRKCTIRRKSAPKPVGTTSRYTFSSPVW
jgi:hypothetical protein